MEKLVIAGREFNSRLFLGTGKFNNNQLMSPTDFRNRSLLTSRSSIP